MRYDSPVKDDLNLQYCILYCVHRSLQRHNIWSATTAKFKEKRYSTVSFQGHAHYLLKFTVIFCMAIFNISADPYDGNDVISYSSELPGLILDMRSEENFM